MSPTTTSTATSTPTLHRSTGAWVRVHGVVQILDRSALRDNHGFVSHTTMTAVEEAIFLTNFARKVTVVHRRDSFRAERILQDRLFKNPKVEVVWDTAIEEITGTADPKSVTGVRLRNVKTGAIETRAVDGVFIAIGHAPATELFVGQLPMTKGNYLITKPDSTATDIPGVFAAGDVKDETFRQAVTAAGMGCMAALEAERYLAHAGEHLAAAQ